MPFSVLVPLIAAPVCAMLPGRNLPWMLATLAALASAVIAATVLPHVMHVTLHYAFGSWEAPIGIEYRVDAANGLVALIISAAAALALLWARTSVDHELRPGSQSVCYRSEEHTSELQSRGHLVC